MPSLPKDFADDSFDCISRDGMWCKPFRYDHAESGRSVRLGFFARGGHNEQRPSGNAPAFEGRGEFRGAVQARRRTKRGTHEAGIAAFR